MRNTSRWLGAAGLRLGVGGLLGWGMLTLGGCVKAPEHIDVRMGEPRPARVDASRVPQPRTLEEAQRELNQAYANIQQLEQDNARLERKADEYKRERDDYKKRLKKFEHD